MEQVQPLRAVAQPDTIADTVAMSDLPDTPPGDAMPTIGQIGRYALKYRIGDGGLGTVYAADDPLLSRRVAIKTLKLTPGESRSPLETDAREPFNQMFLHEARASAQLSHPHIVTVFDAGLSPQGAYIAMELLKGKDLRQLLAEGWRPTPGQAALIVRRVADALAYAHSKGVVHRDVKPANIFMVGRTQPKVLDFGIASIAHAQSSSELIGGSPHYMAPEQVRGEATDRRTDVFSLGVVLYELLTGTRAFHGRSLDEITTAVREHEPPPAYLVAAHVPAALSEISARAMSKRAEDRYRSARALSRELHTWLQEHPEALQSEEDEAPLPHRFRQLGLLALALLGAGLIAYGAFHGWAAGNDAPGGNASTAPAAGPPPNRAAAAAVTGAAPRRDAPGTVDAPAPVPAATDAAIPAAPTATGTLQLAVSPWAEVEVDGRALGTAPPLNQLSLPAGEHRLTLRNSGHAPVTLTVVVPAGESTFIKHRFGP